MPLLDAFWPTTMAGWITAIGFVGGLALDLIDHGQREEKINGWGARVDDNWPACAGRKEEHARLMAGAVWLPVLGGFQVKSAAIAAPTAPSAGYVPAEAASMKTAVDAIRAALVSAGITL